MTSNFAARPSSVRIRALELSCPSPRRASATRLSRAGLSSLCALLVAACVQPEPAAPPVDDDSRNLYPPVVAARPATPASRPGMQQPPADPTPAVDALLNAYEEPGDEATWLRLGDGVKPRLVEVLTSPDQMSLRRARAAEILGWFAGSDEVSLLASFAANTSNPPVARGGALTGLARALGDRATGAVSPYLADSDPLIRRRAARILAELDTPEAREALQDRLPATSGPEREEIERLLAP